MRECTLVLVYVRLLVLVDVCLLVLVDVRPHPRAPPRPCRRSSSSSTCASSSSSTCAFRLPSWLPGARHAQQGHCVPLPPPPYGSSSSSPWTRASSSSSSTIVPFLPPVSRLIGMLVIGMSVRCLLSHDMLGKAPRRSPSRRAGTRAASEDRASRLRWCQRTPGRGGPWTALGRRRSSE